MSRYTLGKFALAGLIISLSTGASAATADSFEPDAAAGNTGDTLTSLSVASRAAAKPIMPGTTQTHSLHTGGALAAADRDIVTFTVSQESDIIAQTDVDVGPADTLLRLFDSTGAELTEDDDGNPANDFTSRLSFDNLPAGTYYISVEEGSLDTNTARIVESYKLSFVSAPTGARQAPIITSASAARTAVGANFTYFITTIGSTPVFFTQQGLPPGLTLVGSTITGAATTSGTFNVTLNAFNGVQPSNSKMVTITVEDFGVITSIAGDGKQRLFGDGGPGTKASLNTPQGVAVDSSGTVFVADTGNNVVRRIEQTTGYIFPAVGTGTAGTGTTPGQALNFRLSSPTDVAIDQSGTLYICDQGNARILRVGPGGMVSDYVVTGLTQPRGICFDTANNMYIADVGTHQVFKVGPGGGTPTAFAGTGAAGFNAASGVATTVQLNTPSDVASDAQGNIFICDTLNSRICRVTPAGALTTIAGTVSPAPPGNAGFSGDNGPATSAQLDNPEGVAVDNNGRILISDNDRIRLVSTNGTISTIVGGGPIDFSATDFGAAASNGGAASTAVLANSKMIAVDSNAIYIADDGAHSIRKAAIAAAPVITSATTASGTKDSPFSPPFRITATGHPFPTFTATNLPAGLSLRDGQITGVPSVSGVADVTITATNTRGTSTSVLRITIAGVSGTLAFSDASPVIVVSPNPASVNSTVTFVAPTVTSGGDLKSYTWNFGDPADTTAGLMETVSHRYSAAGVYTATLTVTDGVTTLTLTSNVAVNAADVSESTIISKAQFKFNFTAENKDSVSLGGSLPLRKTGSTISGATVNVRIGSISKTYTLDSKGTGLGAGGKNDTFKLSAKLDSGAIDEAELFVYGKFAQTIKADTLSDDLAALGFKANVETAKPIKVPILITINGDSYMETVTVVFKSSDKAGTGAKLKEGGSINTR
jgi:sugar lactone lactonase YvrE